MIRCRIGVVAKVVISAMITSIANSVGEMTFISSPIFSTISSIRPRVFISTPSADESRQLSPVIRAAIALPPNLPIDATAMISAHIIHCSYPLTSPICVRRPVYAKNAGSNSTITMSSRRSVISRAIPLSCGITAPSANAPNTAWMPINSVADAEISSAMNTDAITPCVSRPRFPYSSDRRTIAGRTTTIISTINPSAIAIVATAPAACARATPTTKASMHHAVTSSTAAQVSAIAPMRVL